MGVLTPPYYITNYLLCLGLNGQSGHPDPQHPLVVAEVPINNFETFFFMSNDIKLFLDGTR